jgi:hypothetical protein
VAKRKNASGLPLFANLNMRAINALFGNKYAPSYSSGADRPYAARDLLFKYGRDKPFNAPVGPEGDLVYRGADKGGSVRAMLLSAGGLNPKAGNSQAMDALTSALFDPRGGAGKMDSGISGLNLAQGSGSSNRPGMGLSDFGKPFSPNSNGSSDAPNVVGASKHPGPNLNALARQAIMSQYGPILGALNNAEGTLRGQASSDRTDVTRRGNRAEGDLATLYGRLGLYAHNTQRAQDRDYRQGVRQTRHNFNALAGQTSDDLKSSGSGIAADLKRMGVDPSIALAGASKDAAFTRGMAREDRANQVSNTRASRREYDAGMGRMRNDIIATGNAAVGTQKSQTSAALNDIARQLSDGIMQLQMQRAQTLGSRAGALGQLRLSRVQARQAARAAANDPMAKANLLYKLAQIQNLQGKGKTGTGSTGSNPVPTKGLDAAMTYLQSVYPTNTQGDPNWSNRKRTQLDRFLTDLMANSSRTVSTAKNAQGALAYWDPKNAGDLRDALYQMMGKVVGPKGKALYGPTDREAAEMALYAALGLRR